MAADEALLRHVFQPVARLYQWSEPAVSLGYFQPAAEAPPNRPFVRRLTGGALVDHATDLTFTLVFPRDHPLALLGTPECYKRIHESLQSALAAAGISAHLIPCSLDGDPRACFARPVRFDLVDPHNRKLAGGAQRRNRAGVLHQGSILLADPAIRSALPPYLHTAFAHLFDEALVPDDLTELEQQTACELERSRYSDHGWNFSR